MELLNPLKDSQFNCQTVAFTGTPGTVTGYNYGPEGVLVWADSACYVAIGEGVTASATNGTPIPANTPIAFKVSQDYNKGKWTVSAIQISSGGNLYVKPVNIR